MDEKVGNVLAELAELGALGGPETPPPSAPVTVVEVEQGPPSVELRDRRGPQAVEAIDAAVAHLSKVAESLEGARKALLQLREVWQAVEESAPELPLSAPETPEPAAEAPEAAAPPPTPPAAPPAAGETDLDRAREMARRKILGEDLTDAQREAVDAEEDVPFVGQERATLPGQQPEGEVTIGTLGTIKPDFGGEDDGS